jgi:hypothetical protein
MRRLFKSIFEQMLVGSIILAAYSISDRNTYHWFINTSKLIYLFFGGKETLFTRILGTIATKVNEQSVCENIRSPLLIIPTSCFLLKRLVI